MTKPSELFGRDQEWNALARFVAAPVAGPTLAVVHGRRRHGKSALLRGMTDVTGGFYYQAVEGAAAEQLRDFGRAYARHARLPAVPAFDGWDQAIEALLALRDDAGPTAVVLDEFPYLVAASPSLPSRLQRALDAARGRGPRVRVILCGSALTVMTSLLSAQAPLRGRASTEVPIGPFTYLDAARFTELDTRPRLAIDVHAVCGGIPGYYVDMLGGDLPDNPTDFDAWMLRGPLSRTRPLLYEARHLLDDEPGVRDKAALLSVLAAIAEGATTSGAIAGRVGRSAPAVAHPLAALADMRLVTRRDDALRRRRPTWHIADPLLRFYTVVMRLDWTRLEAGRAEQVWRDAQPVWLSQILGPHLEGLAREWVADHAAELVGDGLGTVASAVVADAAGRAAHEIDIVGIGPPGSGQRAVLLGEVKHRCEPLGVEHLHRLRHIHELLLRRKLAVRDATFVLVATGGFTPELRAAQLACDVVLVGPDELYGRAPGRE
ncbi:MAG: ATP-binding protein [Pseudonocardia sp.]